MPASLLLVALCAVSYVAGATQAGPQPQSNDTPSVTTVAPAAPAAPPPAPAAGQQAAAGPNAGAMNAARPGDTAAGTVVEAAPAQGNTTAAEGGGAAAKGVEASAAAALDASRGPVQSTSGIAGGLVADGKGEASLWWPVVAPAAVFSLLGLAAYLLGRRRRTRASPLELVGTLSLGPRRQLVVTRFGGEELLIGSSEAGLHLLVRRPIAAAHGADDAWLTSFAQEEDGSIPVDDRAWQQPPARHEESVPVVAPAEVAAPGGPFEAMLDDSVEDQALRQKLAAGFRGGRS